MPTYLAERRVALEERRIALDQRRVELDESRVRDERQRHLPVFQLACECDNNHAVHFVDDNTGTSHHMQQAQPDQWVFRTTLEHLNHNFHFEVKHKASGMLVRSEEVDNPRVVQQLGGTDRVVLCQWAS
eukprot:TRINITY_DN5218_c0_g1_i1.p3 TRINITY_DN5218_c0_g1~~TRINITY_DN5218_c0_g1_i1.p3  ORF type:complete len:129 (-),score=27.13 TRINITY_DN5218_c0_g1_i1:123-509(-)